MPLAWVVLTTQPQQELLAADAVRARGGESFVPYLPARRRSRRATPLFAATCLHGLPLPWTCYPFAPHLGSPMCYPGRPRLPSFPTRL